MAKILDTEIAEATGFSLDVTRLHLVELAANNEVILSVNALCEGNKGRKYELPD